MRALHELRQLAVSFDQIVAVAFRVRSGETDALQPLNFMHRFEQLHERGLAIFSRNGALAITGHDLPQQSDLLHAAPGQLSAFGNNVSNGAASLFPARIWDNAKCAVLVAA